MPPCEYCKHLDYCEYHWKWDDKWKDCDEFEMYKSTYREVDIQ